TVDGTALAGSDYTATSGLLTFSSGQTSKTIAVSVSGDLVPEPDETFTLQLSEPFGGEIQDGTATGTIRNDDVLSVADASVTEGTSGATIVDVVVSLNRASEGPITVHYATQDDTAVAGVDYVAASGTLSFAAGETTKVLHIQVNGDTDFEPDETFQVVLSDPTGSRIVDGTATVRINNDDTPPPPSFSIGDATLVEGTGAGTSVMRFRVTLSEVLETDVTVDFATADRTANAGSDYTGRSGTLTIVAGSQVGFIDVPIIRDSTVEQNETFTVILSNPSEGTAIQDGSATGTIVNDDASLSIAARLADNAEGDSGSTSFTFTVTRSGDTSGSASAHWAVAGAAVDAADFA